MGRGGTRHDRHQGGSGATALVIVDVLEPCDHPEAALEMMERNLSPELCPAARCSLG